MFKLSLILLISILCFSCSKEKEKAQSATNAFLELDKKTKDILRSSLEAGIAAGILVERSPNARSFSHSQKSMLAVETFIEATGIPVYSEEEIEKFWDLEEVDETLSFEAEPSGGEYTFTLPNTHVYSLERNLDGTSSLICKSKINK